MTLKPSPCSTSAAGASSSTSLAGVGIGEDAELVAAQPIGPPVALDAAVERLAQAREQRVAGEVAEGVVVALEAVEVEEQEHGGVRGAARRRDARDRS